MYSTCTFCHAALGKNEALEHFPVGSRVAFDQARGRLWVVCPSCRQWNLSPLEQRWEAIEEGEKLYRDAKRRVATDQIGMAKLADGTELVRIGEPMRPEFAAWRYGDRFGVRYRRHMKWSLVGAGAVAGLFIAGPAMGLAIGSFSSLPINLFTTWSMAYRDRKVIARLEDEEGPYVLTKGHAGTGRILTDPSSPLGWSLSTMRRRADVPVGRLGPSKAINGEHKDTRIVIAGPAALDALRATLPVVNETGGRKQTVQDAVGLIEKVGSPERVFTQVVKKSGRGEPHDPSWELGALPSDIQLALEMAAHEETERRALEGELSALEAQWKEAEEIAAIADELTLPERVTKRLERLIEGR
jgi:hypothetical protein